MKNWDISYLPHHQTNSFTQIVLDYLANDEKLHSLFEHYPDLENIENAIAAKSKQNINRPVLVEGLLTQYGTLEKTELVSTNINLLALENTFTICTAHQPNIFTGPLYYIYKILHTVALSHYLKNKYTQYNFVPVYYMGSEDADIDEIGTFFMAGKQYKWQPNEGGAVGRLSTESLQTILQEIAKYIDVKTPNGKKIFTILHQAYSTNKTLSEATLILVNALFGEYGVVVFEPDATIFKKQFVAVMQDELLQQTANKIVINTNIEIAKNYKPQAHSREINLFYSIGHSKERIEKNGELFQIVNTEIKFTEQEIIAELHQYPERFSPNVILRGAYQETILPNIIFIGGGGELAYWLQLKNVFTHHHIAYPMLVLRQSISMVNQQSQSIIAKQHLQITDAFIPIHELQKKRIDTFEELNHFENQNKIHLQLFESYQKMMASLPAEFAKSIKAHQTKSSAIQHRLQTKIIAAFKKKENLQMQQLEKLHASFFPENTLQERKENMIPYYLQFGDDFFNMILQSITPFGNEYAIIKI
jgi:bacillithiol synthase